MALPKALLCVLGTPDTSGKEIAEEALLRASGFATATIHWIEVATQQGGWMQLLPIIDDPSVQAWTIVGTPEDFTPEVLSRISMLTLALRRPAPPLTAFVLHGDGEEPALSELLWHVRIFRGNTSFAPKLAAVRARPRPELPRPFHLVAHLDPLIGQWLELAPAQKESWQGFMIGVTGAEVTAFGVGPRDILPEKTTLHYPLCGIKGEWGDQTFSACAAKNEINADNACFIRLEGNPQLVFITAYPEDEKESEDADIRVVELF